MVAKIGFKTLLKGLNGSEYVIKHNCSKQTWKIWNENKHLVQDEFYKNMNDVMLEEFIDDNNIPDISNDQRYCSIDLNIFFKVIRETDHEHIVEENTDNLKNFRHTVDELTEYLNAIDSHRRSNDEDHFINHKAYQEQIKKLREENGYLIASHAILRDNFKKLAGMLIDMI